jgi:hypothetical protein
MSGEEFNKDYCTIILLARLYWQDWTRKRALLLSVTAHGSSRSRTFYLIFGFGHGVRIDELCPTLKLVHEQKQFKIASRPILSDSSYN